MSKDKVDNSKFYRNVKIFTPLLILCFLVILSHFSKHYDYSLRIINNSDFLNSFVNMFDILARINVLGWVLFAIIFLIRAGYNWYLVSFEYIKRKSGFFYMFFLACFLFPYMHYATGIIIFIWVFQWIFAKKTAEKGKHKIVRRDLGMMILVFIILIILINLIWITFMNGEIYMGDPVYEENNISKPIQIIINLILYVYIYSLAVYERIKFTKRRLKGENPGGPGTINLPLLFLLTASYFIFINRYLPDYIGFMPKNGFVLIFCFVINLLPIFVFPLFLSIKKK